MNKKRLFTAAGMSIAIAVGVHLFFAGAISALECRVVKITKKQTVMIEPAQLTVTKGDCVVWFNAAKEPIRVNVMNDKGCGSPVGFTRENACFITNWISPGETVSMTLNELGSYDFQINTKLHPEKDFLGRVAVKCE